MRVQDWKGTEITVGSRVIYGSPETYEERTKATATVIEISEPDVTLSEDEFGREYAHAYEVDLTLLFSDGEKVTLRARDITQRPPVYDYDSVIEVEEIFEESGDIEVIS